MAPQGRIVGGRKRARRQKAAAARRYAGRPLEAIGECVAAELAGLTHRSFTTARASYAPAQKAALTGG